MYPDEFDLYEATTVDEAIDLMEEHAGAETELLAGGHSLLPTMKTGLASPDVVIDIAGIDSMQGIDASGDTIAIGAMTNYAEIADSDAVGTGAPALADAAAAVGDRQVRNMGTIGGNIAHADPASDLPGAVIAANADIIVQGADGERSVAADEFFFGMYATDVGPAELVTRIDVPNATDAVGGYAKRPSPSSGYAIVGVAAQLELDGDTVGSASVGSNGAADHGVRLVPVEDALEGESLSEGTIERAASRATDDLDEAMLMEDLQASGEFRAHLLEQYTERVLAGLAEQAPAPAAD